MTRWTKELVAQAERLWKEGASATEIAKTLRPEGPRFTRNAVIGRLSRKGLMGEGATWRQPKIGAAKFRAPEVKVDRGRGRNGLSIIKAPPPVAAPIPKRVEDLSTAKPLTGRLFGECAAPVAGEGADTLFCCKPVHGETPYCQAHGAIFYTKPKSSGQELARRLGRLA